MRRLVAPAGRLAAALMVCTIAWTTTGCGDSDDGSSAKPGDSTAETASTPAPATDATGERRTDAKSRPGGTGGDSAAGESSRARSGTPDAGSTSGSEQQVTATVEGMYADLAAGDAAGVCSVMSDDAQEQIAQQVPGGSAESEAKQTCASSMSKFMSAAASSGGLERTRAQVKDVKIDGDIATATISLAGSVGRIRLEREDGSWVFGPGALMPRG